MITGRNPTAVVPKVIRRHAADAADLYDIRTVFLAAPHVTLQDLRAHDDRLAANLDALLIVPEEAWRFCQVALESPSAGALFAATILAIEGRHERRLDQLFAVAEALPDVRCGVTSAFGWVGRDRLQGIVADLLVSPDPFRRSTGISACRTQRVDPGSALEKWVQDPDVTVRARALRAVAELGRRDLAPEAGPTDNADLQFWSAWASVLLGDRDEGIDTLTRLAIEPVAFRRRARQLVLQALSVTAAHRLLQNVAAGDKKPRELIQNSGIVGDPSYIPWLIRHMNTPRTARASAEAFTLITGVDLDRANLQRSRPDNIEAGPSDDPTDSNVDMDPDDGLPWPDVKKVEAWWQANESRFQKGTRYFMGKPVTREHCIDVLKNGYQRQRILAAHYLCLLEPGTALFNTSAPAWRQQRLLAAM